MMIGKLSSNDYIFTKNLFWTFLRKKVELKLKISHIIPRLFCYYSDLDILLVDLPSPHFPYQSSFLFLTCKILKIRVIFWCTLEANKYILLNIFVKLGLPMSSLHPLASNQTTEISWWLSIYGQDLWIGPVLWFWKSSRYVVEEGFEKFFWSLEPTPSASPLHQNDKKMHFFIVKSS